MVMANSSIDRVLPLPEEPVLLRVRGRSRCTDGKRSFWGKWEQRIISSSYHTTTWPSESAHFIGNFLVADSDAPWHQVKALEWVGFSGRGKL